MRALEEQAAIETGQYKPNRRLASPTAEATRCTSKISRASPMTNSDSLLQLLENSKLQTMTRREMEKALSDRNCNRMAKLFPLTGPLRRDLYPKHIEFFQAGAQYKERLFMAANRIGKT